MKQKERNIYLLFLFVIFCLASSPSSSSPSTHEPFAFYQLLKLNKGASESEVRRAYRRLSLEYHPDRVHGKEGDRKKAEETFKLINKAYQVLSNSRLRRLFDVYGELYESQESYYKEIEKTKIKELYAFKQGVYLLHPLNLDSLLRGSPYTWIISFYQSGCSSCERKVPFFTSLGAAAEKTKDIRFAMVNCSLSSLCNYFEVQQLGDIILLPPKQEGGDAWDKQEYRGDLNIEEIIKEAKTLRPVHLEEATSDRHVIDKLRQLPTSAAAAAATNVVAAWVVDYYRPSCPPCRRLRSELRRLSRSLSSQIRITLVNCEIGRCDVPFFPYLRLFVKHNNGLIRAHSLSYNTGEHPGAAAIQLVGFIFNSVLNISPPLFEEEEKDKDKYTKYHIKQEEL